MSARRDRLRRGRRHGGPAKALLIILGVLVAAGLAAGIAGAGYVYSIASDAPSISDLKPLAKGESSVVYAADGTKLGTIESDILRTPVPSTEIPQAMRDATVAVEDRRFYEHGGIDVEGILRAAVKNVEEGETVEGGSTLTMQLVRNLYISNEKTWKRKIREAKLAEQLENIHTGEQGKLWVLTKYLNVVPYGTTNGTTAVGVEAAVADVLRQAREAPDARPGGAPRGPPPGTEPVQPVLRARARPRPGATTCCSGWPSRR